MTLQKGNWMQNVSYEAALDRQILEGMIGIEGVVKPTAMKVTNTGALSVSIGPGGAFIKGDDSVGQGMYYVVNDAAAVLTGFSLPPSGQYKVDTVIVRVNDPQAGGTAGNNVTFGIVPGSPVAYPAGTPVPAALPASALALAYVTLIAGDSLIEAGDIVNARKLCGGIEHIGEYSMWPVSASGSGVILPAGKVACNGAELNRAAYPDLFEVIGTTFGSQGPTTFTLPNFTGRMPAGLGVAPGGSLNKQIGTPGGADTVTIQPGNLPAHVHTINHDHGNSVTDQQGTHSHAAAGQANTKFMTSDPGAAAFKEFYDANGTPKGNAWVQPLTADAGAHQHNFDMPAFTGNSGNGPGTSTALDNLPPYMPVQVLIKAL